MVLRHVKNKVSHMTPTPLVGRATAPPAQRRREKSGCQDNMSFSAVAPCPCERETFPGVLLSAQFSVYISSAVHFLELLPSSSSSISIKNVHNFLFVSFSVNKVS